MLRTHFLLELNSLVSESQSQKYVLGLSGGVDSIVLFNLLVETLPNSNLIVAHFNHKTRGLESDADEAFVRSLCAKAKIKCKVASRKGESTSEASLRNERLQFLKRVCKESRSDYILLAHHQQDQLETFMMRLLRGTGVRGLSGIRAKNGKLIRPLLGISKSEIESYAKQCGLEYRMDSSNLSQKYFRNRIRLELLPVFLKLTENYGGEQKFYERFLQLSASLASISEKDERAGRRYFKKIAVKTEFFIRLNKKALLRLTTEDQNHLMREIFWQLNLETPDRRWLKRILLFLERDKGALSLPKGRVLISCGEVYFQNLEMVKLPQPKIVKRAGIWNCAKLGLEIKVPREWSHLQLRFFTPGDRIGSTKLKKYFLEERVPAPERGLIPILAKKGSSEVYWVFQLKNHKGENHHKHSNTPLVKHTGSKFPYTFT